MVKSKPPLCLNPHTKSLFLQHSHKIVCERLLTLPEFFKFLLISKGYLYASQRFRIYTLKLEYSGSQGDFRYFYENEEKEFKENFLISFCNLAQLNQLLKFPCVKVEFADFTSPKVFDLFEKLFEGYLVEAKLAFYFLQSYVHHSHAASFISMFSKRINQIQCMSHSLACTPLNLDYCRTNPVTYDEMKSVLKKHQIKKLHIDCQHLVCSIFNLTNFPSCPRLQTLIFKGYNWQGKRSEIFEKPLKMFQFFPNLQKFIILNCRLGSAITTDKQGSQRLVNFALEACENIHKFKKACCSSLKVELEFCFDEYVLESQETVLASIKRLKEEEEIFNEAKVILTKNYAHTNYSVISNYENENFKVNFNVLFREIYG